MSEYQYYEFAAIDEPLNEKDMDVLRDLSTRAQITPTSFVNEYHWGDFKGDPLKLVTKYFDAFVYLKKTSICAMLRICCQRQKNTPQKENVELPNKKPKCERGKKEKKRLPGSNI